MIIDLLIIWIGIGLAYLAYRTYSNKIAFYTISFLTLLFLASVAGARDLEVGYDVTFYGLPTYRLARVCQSLSEFFVNNDSSEYIFSFFMYLIAHTVNDFHIALGIISFITVLFAYMAAVNFRNYVPSWLTFALYLLMCYAPSFNLLRQSMAVSMCLFAYTILLQKGISLKFMMISLLAVLTHNTSVLAIAMLIMYYIIPKMKNTTFKRFYLVFIILMGVIFISISTILSSMSGLTGKDYSIYTDTEQSAGWAESVVPYSYYIYIIIFAICSLKAYKKNIVNYHYYNIVLCTIVISILCFILGSVYTGSILRMANYFLIWTAFDMCYYMQYYSVGEKKRIRLTVGILLLFLFLFFRTFDIGLSYQSKILGF